MYRYTLKQLACCVAGGAIILTVWKTFYREEFTVRAATPRDTVFERYGGVEPVIAVDNICIVTGKYFASTRLTLRMYHIRGGKRIEVGTATVGRTPNATRIFPIAGEVIPLTLALCESDLEYGRFYCLGLHGKLRGAGKEGIARFPAPFAARATFDGTLPKGREVILHVAADSAFQWSQDLSVDDFVLRTPSSFLIITGYLH